MNACATHVTRGGELHRHAPILQPCTGCQQRICRPGDGWRTTAGFVFVCDGCVARHRADWQRAR